MKIRVYKVVLSVLIVLAIVVPLSVVTVAAATDKNAETQSVSKIAAPKVTKVSSSKPKLSWTKVSGATGYTVYRKVASDKDWVKAGTATTTSFTDSKLTAKAGEVVKYKIISYKTVQMKSENYAGTMFEIDAPPESIHIIK